jgi:hypothetical protein
VVIVAEAVDGNPVAIGVLLGAIASWALWWLDEGRGRV